MIQLRIVARRVRWLLVLVRWGAIAVGMAVKTVDLLAPQVQDHWQADIRPYALWLVAIGAVWELLLRNNKLVDFIKEYSLRVDFNFAKVLWPEQPPALVAPEESLANVRRLVQAQCSNRLANATENQEERPVVLPQRFWAYSSIIAFLGDNPTLQARLGVPYEVIGNRLGNLAASTKNGQPQPTERTTLPPLNAYKGSTTGSLTIITGEAGSGKSRALLQQIKEHKGVGDKPGRRVVPVYLDLADWHKLFDVTDGFRLERWACAFMCKEYGRAIPGIGARAIKPEEAIWLLHKLNRAHLQLVLCLDGLDELPAEYHKECLEAILDYKAAYGHVVVTCRKKELVGSLLALSERQRTTDCQVLALRDFATEQEVDEALILHKCPRLEKPAPLADLPADVQAAGRLAAADLLACRREHRMHEYLNTPLLINLFVKVFPEFDARVLHQLAGQHAAVVPGLLWAEYEKMQRAEYEKPPAAPGEGQEARWQQAAPWPLFRGYLHHIALQAASNSFSLDAIQPHRWLASPLVAVPNPVAQLLAGAPAPPAADAPAAAVAEKKPAGLSHLGWYYLTSRLLVGLVLAVAVGLLIARFNAFLGDGILIGGLAALFTARLNQRPPGQPARHYVLNVLGLVLLMVLLCSLYEGLSVPHKPGDMRLHGLFSITQATFGVIVGLIAGIVLGFRRAHTRETDISLVEKLGFKWLEALGVGLLGGLGSGILIGLVGVGLVKAFPGMTLDTWLRDFLPGWKQRLPWLMHLLPAHTDAAAVFALAFAVAGLVGFVLVTLLASLDRKHGMLEENERNGRPKHYGVAQSGRYGFYHGALVLLLLLAGLLGLAARADGQYLAHLRAYLSIATGAGLIAFLWFGGVEVMQHYTLRVHLALLRLLPLRFGRWLSDARELAFVQDKSGPSIKFMHARLHDYLQWEPATSPAAPAPPPRRRDLWVFRRAIVLLMVGLVAVPLLRRWCPLWPAAFWPHNNAFVLRPAAGVLVLNDSTVRVQQAGQLCLRVQGRVHVGDIAGSVGPRGTAYGFLGIGLSHAYDRFAQGQHGALFYKVERVGGGTPWRPLLPGRATWREWAGPLAVALPEPVRPGDRVRFALNDAEWQNNSGAFRLDFGYDQESPPSLPAARP